MKKSTKETYEFNEGVVKQNSSMDKRKGRLKELAQHKKFFLWIHCVK
jgi:hypothetical protein